MIRALLMQVVQLPTRSDQVALMRELLDRVGDMVDQPLLKRRAFRMVRSEEHTSELQSP